LGILFDHSPICTACVARSHSHKNISDKRGAMRKNPEEFVITDRR